MPPPPQSSPQTWQLTILSFSFTSMALLISYSRQVESNPSRAIRETTTPRLVLETFDNETFLCRTTRGYQDQQKRYVRTSQVCDGNWDCEDHSDEWWSLCSRVCRRPTLGLPQDEELYFKCVSLLSWAVDGPLQGEAPYSTEGLVGDPLLGEASYFQNQRNQTRFPSDNERNRRVNLTALNTWSSIEVCSSDVQVEKLYFFCNGREDCLPLFGEPPDEDHCYCDWRASDCNSKGRGDAYWWVSILGTAFGIVLVFAFCVCLAIHWGKSRAVFTRRRERRRSEALNRRSAATQLNLGLSLSAAEFNMREENEENQARAAGRATVAPPPYSATMEFPKPEVVAEPGELPPPYQPEWVGAFQARDGTVAAPAAPVYVPTTPPTVFVTSNPAAAVTIAATAGTAATTADTGAAAVSSVSGINDDLDLD